MTDKELIELSRAYVALSNAHRVDLIMNMFAAGAMYNSTSAGEFRGRAAIGDMMHGFFADYPDAYWSASNYRCEDDRVSFDIDLSATAAADGASLQRWGVEQLDFTADGSIKKIRVEISTAD